jgi:hypothetical protein
MSFVLPASTQYGMLPHSSGVAVNYCRHEPFECEWFKVEKKLLSVNGGTKFEGMDLESALHISTSFILSSVKLPQINKT